MIKLKLGASLASICLAAMLVQSPARAASPMSQAFLANVAANLAILDTSSRMTKERTHNPDVAAYALDETSDAGQVAVALAEATPADHNILTADAGAPLLSGRSVAVAGMTGRIEAIPAASVLEAANSRMPATADLATLKMLRGSAFDRAFFILQLDALSQIESDYRTYIKEGDDPGLATMAHQQLPGLMKRLEALTRV